MPRAAGHLDGKTCLVTGATSGIGTVTALALARMGAAVVLVGRDPRKCARQAARIRRATGSPVEHLVADLSSQREIHRLAEECRARFPRLDVLVNNAGALYRQRQVTVDGLERTFALNHLAYFLLTNLLLDSLRASPSARIVNVSSCAHEQGRIDFEDLQGERHYERLEAYSQSKLANLLFTFELARRLKGSPVTVNALHPGIVATRLGANDGWWRTRLRNLLRPGMLSPEAGAETSVYLASAPEVEGVSGRYFHLCREIPCAQAACDEACAERLWRISEELTGPKA